MMRAIIITLAAAVIVLWGAWAYKITRDPVYHLIDIERVINMPDTRYRVWFLKDGRECVLEVRNANDLDSLMRFLKKKGAK